MVDRALTQCLQRKGNLFCQLNTVSGLEMKLASYIKRILEKFYEIRKARFHLLLLCFFFMSILLILFLDFFDIEVFVPFNQKFMFDLTWKGRMFYLFFMWLLLLEVYTGLGDYRRKTTRI